MATEEDGLKTTWEQTRLRNEAGDRKMRRIEYKGVEERQWDNYTTFAVMYDYCDGGSRNVGCIFICSSGTMSAHILFA